MDDTSNIFGCFFKVGFNPELKPEDFENTANQFRPYIFGEKSISSLVKNINYTNYGEDIKLILFQFYIDPTHEELQKIKEIEPYRRNEKSIGVPIIVDSKKFFNQTNDDRFNFLKKSLLSKMDLLEHVVIEQKLDTNVTLLKSNLQSAF